MQCVQVQRLRVLACRQIQPHAAEARGDEGSVMAGLNLSMLKAMMHSPIRNYAIPGLTSWLIGEQSPNGTMRFFECSRHHQEPITPHSHRFDFQCWVLAGSVCNRVWTPTAFHGDEYTRTDVIYLGECGKYKKDRIGPCSYTFRDKTYGEGDWYSMTHDQIHSIYFSKGTQVLFFEGPTRSDRSLILEPHIDGEDVPTFKVEPWMFKQEAA
jgi:hypothetical protein